jgi:hypothetical protein
MPASSISGGRPSLYSRAIVVKSHIDMQAPFPGLRARLSDHFFMPNGSEYRVLEEIWQARQTTGPQSQNTKSPPCFLHAVIGEVPRGLHPNTSDAISACDVYGANICSIGSGDGANTGNVCSDDGANAGKICTDDGANAGNGCSAGGTSACNVRSGDRTNACDVRPGDRSKSCDVRSDDGSKSCDVRSGDCVISGY